MKICLIATKFYPDHVGGKAVYTYNYYRELRKRGYNIKVLTGLWNKKIKDPNIIQFKIIRKRYLWIITFLLFTIKHLIFNKYEIVHAVGVREGIIPLILFRRFIATVHDPGSFQVNVNIVQKFYPLIISKASIVITPSNTTKKQLKYYLPKLNSKKIIPILNGVDLDKYNPRNRDKAEKLKRDLNLKGKVILYLGIIKTYKGVEDIIEAFKLVKKEIKDVNLIIAGAPDDRMKDRYKKMKNNNPDILFTGRVSDKLIPLYYAMADIFVTYSYTGEGFGLTAVEAMASGTPVICSKIDAYKEVLKDKAILVPPKNFKLLSRAIIELLKDDDKRNKIAEEGRKFIEQNYSWDNTIKNLIKVYRIMNKKLYKNK